MAERRWIAETLFDAEGFRMSYAAERVLQVLGLTQEAAQ